MLSTPLLVTLLAYAETTDLAHQVQIQLSAAAQPWLSRQERKLDKLLGDKPSDIVVDLEVNKRGGFTRVRASLSSGKKPLDRLIRSLFQVLPPLPKPPDEVRESKGNVPCLIHARLSKPKSLVIGVVCLPSSEPVEVARREGAEAPTAIGKLFSGYDHEGLGEGAPALADFRAAHDAAPTWYQATLALGVTLARDGKLAEARPLLKKAGKQRALTAEVKRLLSGKVDTGPIEEPEEPGKGDENDVPDDGEVSGCQRDESEIFKHVQKQLKPLNACVLAERDRNPKAEMPETVAVAFVVTPEGPIKGIGIQHRFYRTGELNRCVQRALAGQLKPVSGGTSCPVQFEINLGGIDD